MVDQLAHPVTPVRRTRRHRVLAPALLVTALLIGACGGGDDPELIGGATTTDSTPGPTPPPETPTPAPPAAPTATPPPPASGNGDPAFTSGSKVTTVGVDAVIFGMTVAEAADAQGTVWEPLDEGASGPCYVVRPFSGPDGITLTIADGRVERIDVTTDLITTRSGAGVNSTEDELRELFGTQLFEEATADGKVLQFVPVDENDQAFRIYFESNGTVVTRYRAGRVPIVNPALPCG